MEKYLSTSFFLFSNNLSLKFLRRHHKLTQFSTPESRSSSSHTQLQCSPQYSNYSSSSSLFPKGFLACSSDDNIDSHHKHINICCNCQEAHRTTTTNTTSWVVKQLCRERDTITTQATLRQANWCWPMMMMTLLLILPRPLLMRQNEMNDQWREDTLQYLIYRRFSRSTSLHLPYLPSLSVIVVTYHVVVGVIGGNIFQWVSLSAVDRTRSEFRGGKCDSFKSSAEGERERNQFAIW